jgi:hypothetical protein
MDAEDYLRRYNQLTSDVAKSLRLRPRPVNPQTIREAQAFLDWAREEKVDPVLFTRARHEAAPGARIPIQRLSTVQPSFLEKYREWGEDRQGRIAAQARHTAVEDRDARTDLTVLSEAARAAFADDREVCRLSVDVTGGWHPQSPHCQACRVATECRDALPRPVRRAREWGQRARSK